MNRHRKFLIAAGAVQMVAAIALFANYFARLGVHDRRTADEISEHIVEVMEMQGANVDAHEDGSPFDPHYAFGWRIESAIYDAERRATIPIVGMGVFGAVLIAMGCILDRPNVPTRDSDELLA